MSKSNKSARGSGRKHNYPLPPPASLNLAWPRLKRSPFSFALAIIDHAVAVLFSMHKGDAFACLVEDSDHAAVIRRIQLHRLFTILLGRNYAVAGFDGSQTHQVFAVGMIDRDRFVDGNCRIQRHQVFALRLRRHDRAVAIAVSVEADNDFTLVNRHPDMPRHHRIKPTVVVTSPVAAVGSPSSSKPPLGAC